MVLRRVEHLGDFRLGDLIGVDPSHAESRAVDVEPHLVGRHLVVPEDLNQDSDDKLHGGVVVVVDQHLVHRWLLGLRAFLSEDAFVALCFLVCHSVGMIAPGRGSAP